MVSQNESRWSGISASSELGLLPPPFTGEGWGEGEQARIFSRAPSLSLPRKRGREHSECAAVKCGSHTDLRLCRRERRLRRAGGAERQGGGGVEGAAERGEACVLAGARDQRDAERRAVGVQRGRHRERAKLEQVDEIGVGAEPTVERNRIGARLIDRVHRRR